MVDNQNNPISIQPIGQMVAKDRQQEQGEINGG